MDTSQYPPAYPGFKPDIVPNSGQSYPPQPYPYPTAPSQQFNVVGQPYPSQPYMPGQQMPINQPYPGQQFPPGQAMPGQQFPINQNIPGQQYPPPPGGEPQGNFGPYGPPPMPLPMHLPEVDIKEESYPGWVGFSDKAIRSLFIRKVYLILMVQLVFSLGVIALFVFEPHVKFYVQRNRFWYYVSYVLFLVVYIALACCENLRRNYPTNMIMLSIFTITMSYMLGTISSFYETDVVLLAVGICAAVCLTVSIFSFHTKFDFTSCGGILFVMCIVLFIFGIITIFTYNNVMHTIYAGCGALLFTAFLAYDTQMLMGGKKHELSPEEHIFAAMQIYLDIAYIFIFLLSLLGSSKK